VTANLLAGLLSAALAIPLCAQSAAPRAFSYDISNEVSITGTVSAVLIKPAAGMIGGSHILISTPSGMVDVSLGRFGLTGKGALSGSAGEKIDVTGVMRTVKDQQVFMARTVQVGGESFTIRNEHGVEVPPQARPDARENSGTKGNSL